MIQMSSFLVYMRELAINVFSNSLNNSGDPRCLLAKPCMTVGKWRDCSLSRDKIFFSQASKMFVSFNMGKRLRECRRKEISMSLRY